MWTKTYSGGGPDNEPADLKIDKYENVYITGVAQYPITGTDFTTIKYLPNGTQQWVATYNGIPPNGNDAAKGLCIDTGINIYVTGISQHALNSSQYDAVTIKYSQPVGIRQIGNQLPKRFELYQNYPNPFNPITRIKFDVPKDQYVSIKVFDVLGREVAVLVAQTLKSGSYEVQWNATNYPSGIYFYKIETINYAKTKKMVLLK